MNTMRLTSFASLVAIAGLAATPALAANAYVLQDSTLYEEASNGSDPVNNVDEGQLVDVLDCEGNYCLLKVPGPDGWIRSNRLGGLSSGKPSSKVPFSFGFSVGGDGKPSISIGIGNGPKPPKPPVEDDKVCFFKNSNYGGSSFCAEPGDSDDSLPGNWDNTISSIRVYGDAEVLVCRDDDLEGVCAEITSSKKTLPNALNNRISSYEVN